MFGYPQSVEKWIETESLSSLFVNFFYHIWWFFKYPQYTNTCIEKSSNVTKILLSIEKGMSVKFAFNLLLFNRGNQNLRVGLANISASNSKWTKNKGWLEIVLCVPVIGLEQAVHRFENNSPKQSAQ